MKERPIIFSTPMVKAILEGRKTQTRRIIKPQPPEGCKYTGVQFDITKKQIGFYWTDGTTGDNHGYWPGLYKNLISPYGMPGDLLWVRETFSIYLNAYLFKSTNTIFKGVKWKPSIHMPKAVAQVWLKITHVKVERLQDISEEDARDEGVDGNEWVYINRKETSYKNGFFSLWVDIYGSNSFNKNPWVWAIEFEVISTTGKPATSNK